jgi:hypothetical protein
MPINTRERADVIYCKANEDSSGKPSTAPSATTMSEANWVLAGHFSLKINKAQSASSPATPARVTVRNTGGRYITAAFVAGMEPLKATTPKKPLIQPLVGLYVELPDNDLLFIPQN